MKIAHSTLLLACLLLIFTSLNCQRHYRKSASESPYRQYRHLYYLRDGLPYVDSIVLLEDDRFECRRSFPYHNDEYVLIGTGTHLSNPTGLKLESDNCKIEPRFRLLHCKSNQGHWVCHSGSGFEYTFMMVIG